jgi:hypothetical protein
MTGGGGLLQLLSASLSACRRYHPAGVERRIGQRSTFHTAFTYRMRVRPPVPAISGPPMRSLALRPADSLPS